MKFHLQMHMLACHMFGGLILSSLLIFSNAHLSSSTFYTSCLDNAPGCNLNVSLFKIEMNFCSGKNYGFVLKA